MRGATRAVSTAVVFPPSDFRYYRIRATGVKKIRGATAEAVSGRRRSGRAAGRDHVHQEARQTVIDADVGYRGLPVNELRFASSTPAFDRPVEITGSKDGKAFFRRRRRPDLTASASAGETTVPVDSRYRYLRIRIANGDDEPLGDLA